MQALKGGRSTPSCLDHRDGLWKAILRAAGFPGSFSAWWRTRPVTLVGDLDLLPHRVPQLGDCQKIFLSFEAKFRHLETKLLGARKAAAIARREADPAAIFRDLKLPLKAPVESLMEVRSSTVSQVCQDEMALELESPVQWDAALPFTCEGLPLHVLHVEPDKLWVAALEGLAGGVQVEQARLIGSLLEIFSEFGSEWGKRWMRHEGVDAQAWQHLADSFRDFTPFPAMQPSPITVPMWRAALKQKSPGPDGLSRKDLLAMPWELTEEVLSILRISEEHGLWPQQLLTGLISSLEKVPGAAKVSHDRPICVLSLCYRTWSSLRCKEALRHVAQFAPPGLLGNLPGAGASDSWYSILLQIEGAYRAGRAIWSSGRSCEGIQYAAQAAGCGVCKDVWDTRLHLDFLGIHVDATSPPLQSAWQHGTPSPLQGSRRATL